MEAWCLLQKANCFESTLACSSREAWKDRGTRHRGLLTKKKKFLAPRQKKIIATRVERPKEGEACLLACLRKKKFLLPNKKFFMRKKLFTLRDNRGNRSNLVARQPSRSEATKVQGNRGNQGTRYPKYKVTKVQGNQSTRYKVTKVQDN